MPFLNMRSCGGFHYAVLSFAHTLYAGEINGLKLDCSSASKGSNRGVTVLNNYDHWHYIVSMAKTDCATVSTFLLAFSCMAIRVDLVHCE